MSAFIATHLWQSTIVVGLAAAVAWLLRGNHARTRHAVWMLASVKFLLPFAVLVAAGEQLSTLPGIAKLTSLSWRAAQLPGASDAVDLFETATQPFAFAAVPISVSASPVNPSGLTGLFGVSSLTAIVLALWIAGTLLVVGVWLARWIAVKRQLSGATPLAAGREVDILARVASGAGLQPVPLLASTGPMEPGVVGCRRPVILWPAQIGERLSDDQIAAIMLHELVHVRRRDNLLSIVHMFVEAAFWFHPLVWYVGARLLDAREEACDEEVVRLGADPDQYAESILRTCEWAAESQLACVAGVTGADLKHRVSAIVRHRTARVGVVKLAFLTTIGVACAIVPIAAGAITSPLTTGALTTALASPMTPLTSMRLSVKSALIPAPAAASTTLAAFKDASATLSRSVEASEVAIPPASPATSSPDSQAPATPAANAKPDLKFEVTSIKLVREDDSGPAAVAVAGSVGAGAGNYFRYGGPVSMLIEQAYGLRRLQLLGGPDWLSRDDSNYRIVAKIPDGVERTQENMQTMLRALLAERFKLVVRPDERMLPIYVLTYARADKRLGPNLKPSDCPAAPPFTAECTPRMGLGGRNAYGQNADFARFAPIMENFLGRTIVDRTGLTGRYNWEVGQFGPGGAPLAQDGPDFLDALQDRLGLKLESDRASIKVVVVESVERPTEN